MKFLSTIIFLLSFLNLGHTQSSKTFTKPFNVETSTVSLDFSDDICIKATNESPRINWSIESNSPLTVLEALIKSGRYEIKSEIVNGVTVLRIPKLATKIKLQAAEIVEKIKCEIFLPQNIEYVKYEEVLN